MSVPAHRVAVADIPGMDDALRGAGILTAEDARRIDAIERASFCLVRIDGVGERWRCGECNGRHAHFTKFCIPLPYRGLRDGLRAYWKNTGVSEGDLTIEQSALRVLAEEALGVLDTLRHLPSLALSHPETARALGTHERSVEIGAWAIGVIDPISPARARLYAAQINAKARRVIVRI